MGNWGEEDLERVAPGNFSTNSIYPSEILLNTEVTFISHLPGFIGIQSDWALRLSGIESARRESICSRLKPINWRKWS